MQANRHPTLRRHQIGLALVMMALMLFVLCATWLQFARADLDWAWATLSLYLHGPHGVLLRVAYCLLALAIGLLAWMLHAQAQGVARRALPPALFTVAGLGLAGVAIGDSWLPQHAPLLAPLVHGLSAQTAFLCVTVAMLLQAWCFGRDPRWSSLHRWSWWWAWLAFAGLWLHVLWRASPRGLGQKLVVALVVGWLLMVAIAAWRRLHKGPAETFGSGHNGDTIQPRETTP